ncbi:meckelin [Choristoneura fumiferana]|uniref:meckelin n=1 Tax=Choristoneura fumiferana TaxID=7141 RepID=UPI003D1559CA
MPLSAGDTLSPFLQMGGSFNPLPVALRKPNGSPVKRATWPTDKFRRYFVTHNYLSTTTNTTSTIYLRTLLIHLRMQRSKSSLRVHLTIQAQYAAKPTYTRAVTTSLQVEHEMPSAGVLRGLEIWGGVLGALLSCYALLQWRGVLRRGGPQAALLPLLAGSTADAMYFAVWLSTLHALAVEAGSFGLTLPPSAAEERIIRAFVYSAIALKGIKVIWVNWRQCRCDIFFLDWSEYNPPIKDEQFSEDNMWKTRILAREWSAMQARRRVSPGITITLALINLHLFSPWLESLPSPGYVWSAGCICWWASYSAALLASWVRDRLVPAEAVSRICEGVGLSLLVFEEEYYAHYVHGRNNGSPDVKSMSGPLQACRVACAPQLRVVYKQLSTPGLGALTEGDTRQALLSRFLAAFFERALDGLSWVASERTVLERLLDVEIAVREAGNTSALLYGPDDSTPSYLAVTWWGQEWTLATLDAMVFGCVLLAAGDWLLAALTTLIVWQAMKHSRKWFGDRNLKQNIGIETMI